MEHQPNNPLHGITLEHIVTYLAENHGWHYMASEIHINCFCNNPSIKSSLTFLRKTPWARTKVENLYLQLIEIDNAKLLPGYFDKTTLE